MLQHIFQLLPRTLIIYICYILENQFQSPYLLYTYILYISACKHHFWSPILNVFFHVPKHKLPVFIFRFNLLGFSCKYCPQLSPTDCIIHPNSVFSYFYRCFTLILHLQYILYHIPAYLFFPHAQCVTWNDSCSILEHVYYVLSVHFSYFLFFFLNVQSLSNICSMWVNSMCFSRFLSIFLNPLFFMFQLQ